MKSLFSGRSLSALDQIGKKSTSRFCTAIVCLLLAFIACPVSSIEAQEPDLAFMYDDWAQFVQGAPVLLRVQGLPEYYRHTISRQETLVSRVIESHLASQFPSIDKRFEKEVAMLADEVPGATKAEGTLRKKERQSYNYYYGGTWTYTREVDVEVTEQADPDMVKDFTMDVRNVRASEISILVDRMGFKIESWRKKMEALSKSGTIGIRREAGLKYIKAVEEYHGEWKKLHRKIQEFEAEFGKVKEQRQKIGADWAAFETAEMPQLRKHMESYPSLRADTGNPKYFSLDGTRIASDEIIVAKLSIGGRDLFFRVYPENKKLQALRLVRF